MNRRTRSLKKTTCPACAGMGTVCCLSWAMVRANAGEELTYSGVGVPEWPLMPGLEMARCPFCGKPFDRIKRSQ